MLPLKVKNGKDNFASLFPVARRPTLWIVYSGDVRTIFSSGYGSIHLIHFYRLGIGWSAVLLLHKQQKQDCKTVDTMVLQSVQRNKVRCAYKGILSRNMERRLVVRIRNRVIPWLRNVQLCIPVAVKLFFKRKNEGKEKKKKKGTWLQAEPIPLLVICLRLFHIHCLHTSEVSRE